MYCCTVLYVLLYCRTVVQLYSCAVCSCTAVLLYRTYCCIIVLYVMYCCTVALLWHERQQWKSMFHFGNVEIGQLSRDVGDRQTDGVSYLKQNEAHTVLQCNQTHKKKGEVFWQVNGWTYSSSRPQDNKHSCQDNGNATPKHISIQDETKTEQTQSDKLQSAEEERTVNIAHTHSLL